jgi:epoxyqueuosine reductase
MPNSTPDIRDEIRATALREGFDVVRFVRAEAPQNAAANLHQFLSEQRHGTMEWMARNAERRARPDALWPEAKSIVVLGMNYGPKHDPREGLTSRDRATISCYAQGDDYHDVIKGKLKRLASSIAQQHGAEVKIFVDTAPVMEKPLAQQAGVGWQGKHTNLVSRLYGSWLFLGSIFTTLEMAADEFEPDHCGACTRCLDACPTDAFTTPYQIDARRCISYLTVEHKAHIAPKFRKKMGNRIYGCDDCLAVCPWNKFAAAGREQKFFHREDLSAPLLAELAALDDVAFRQKFSGSPVKRIGRNRFVRNVAIAIGNSADPLLMPAAELLARDADPVVAEAGAWAVKRLA